METERRFCPAVWFSGFFGVASVLHLIRGLLGTRLVLGDWEVPTGTSLVLFVVFAVISALLVAVALKRPCCAKEKSSCGGR